MAVPLGREVADVVTEMTDETLARSAEAMKRPIRFRLEHGKRSTRIYASGICAITFLVAVADRYGVDEPTVDRLT